ncbi:ABC transporter permease [Paenibacillus baekrokdamisoli]|uniref:ABC transporter permease n=1 Tax=Paenibacillus baekrokdamisoli TaxID=1712516 RepID=A0A3G9IJ20_9BACL|nr:carbohydrate ABC transporter permease [Paenibacillus baekrokdamisoli]MBB3072715.1 multiple sugar transport system permease protein [Paenibacillus baekrokdamisoli]BBH18997.1 ABC transporter permease [Paenibacillus baekrokdamisoli]
MNAAFWKRRVKVLLLGNGEKSGWLIRILIYLILLDISVIYLNPFFYMIATMFKSGVDLVDPTIRWIPRVVELENLKLAWQGLRYLSSLSNSLLIVSLGAIFQVVFCSLAGYAFARISFPGKTLLFGLLLFSFLIPPQTIIIPLYILFGKLGWLGTPLAIVGPAIFGHGIKGALFVIIFRQFFMTLPKELEEAAKIDGAGMFRVYWRVIMPLSTPALLVVFLFSFIWHWNDTTFTQLMLRGEFTPLSISLNGLDQVLNGTFGQEKDVKLNETVRMAASFLVIFPPLIVYFIAQRWFVEGVERTGLVE